MKFSIIIPAFNEEANISKCIVDLNNILKSYEYEFVIVNDGSTDRTGAVLKALKTRVPIKIVDRPVGDNGIGKAIKSGLRVAVGEYIIITMADSSDDPRDTLRMIQIASKRDVDGIFGTRFSKGGTIVNYPPLKLLVNRLYNHLVSVLLAIPHDDMSNAFKMYRRQLVQDLDIESDGFDITIELSVKALLRAKKNIVVIPTRWYGRKKGLPKWKIVREGLVYLKRLYNLYVFFRHERH
ncbi:MAG: glycosyltransferase family 2 protein [Candidatus Sigynarchaeota archaeon]